MPAPQYAFLVMVRVEVDICISIGIYWWGEGGRGVGRQVWMVPLGFENLYIKKS